MSNLMPLQAVCHNKQTILHIKETMNYSKRINTIISLLKPGKTLADIGCDHGYVSIGAAEKGLFPHIIAADVQSGPLSKAKAAVEAAGLSDVIDLQLSDGFQSITRPVDAVVICGMGGLLIKDILERGHMNLGTVNQMILGPHSEIPALREYLKGLPEFELVSETVIRDLGKFYVLMNIKRKIDFDESSETIPTELNSTPMRDMSAGQNSDPVQSLSPALMTEYGDPRLQTDLTAYRDYLLFQKKQAEKLMSRLSGETGAHAQNKLDALKAETADLNQLLQLNV